MSVMSRAGASRSSPSNVFSQESYISEVRFDYEFVYYRKTRQIFVLSTFQLRIIRQMTWRTVTNPNPEDAKKTLTIDFWKIKVLSIDWWRGQNLVRSVHQVTGVLLIMITNAVIVHHAFTVMIRFLADWRWWNFWVRICIGVGWVEFRWSDIQVFTVRCAVNGGFGARSWVLRIGYGASKVFTRRWP